MRPTLARGLSLAALLCLLAVALSGCGSKPGAGPDGGSPEGGPDAEGGPDGAAAAALNVTSPHFGGAPYVREYSGVAREDPAAVNGVPTGLARGPFQSCCAFAWVEAPDLFPQDQLAALRVTLRWTNTAQGQANLDVAACIPWYCDYAEAPDQTDQPGEHEESFDIVSGGHRQYADQGLQYFVGARYSNLVAPNGVPFTVQVEAIPVQDALAFMDPYEVEVPAGSTLVAEMVAPLREDAEAAVMVYGEDDRPMAYRPMEGPSGTRVALATGPGSFVVTPFDYAGSLVRLLLENATAEPKPARPLQETFGMVTVAAVADPAPREGTFTFEAPPGSLDTFPWFVYDGPSVQYPGVGGSGIISLESSSGLIARADITALGAVSPVGQTCVTCNSVVDWSPENYLDDDGTYQVAYSSSQATGSFVLFTATYSR